MVLFFDKGTPTRKVWYYSLDVGRNMGKTNPLNDSDLVDFIELQSTFADSPKSWSVDVTGIDQSTFDLSVKNPDGGEEVVHRSPLDIMDEIAVLDQAMHEASAELISAAEYRRSLLEMMAHDLRNPLMSIGLAFDVMLKTSREGQVAVPDKRVRSLRHSLDQITALLEDLLTPDRMESTKLELDLSLVKADELVSDACDFVRTQCDAKSITIESTIDDASVIADHNRLMQVLSNFIGNAIRYSPAGSTVKVSVLQKNGRVRFAVADQGPGIPGALQGKLFEKYFQIPQGKKAVASTGYGLGLSICKQIITSHHGQIGVDSEVGRGSTFWFELPLDDDDDDDDDVN